jgi:hypothetical protein
MNSPKLCTQCGNPGEFGKRKRSKDGLKSACNKCSAKYQKRWYAANTEKFKGYVQRWNVLHPEQYKAVRRPSFLKRLYGMSIEDFTLMLEAQDNKCAICHLEFNDSRVPFVDHDHEIAKVDKRKSVRGLLCHRCNVGLGQFDENPQRLSAAIEYLQTRVYVPKEE